MCSGIQRGRLFNGEPYAQRFQKLIYLQFVYRLFHEDFSSLVGTSSGPRREVNLSAFIA